MKKIFPVFTVLLFCSVFTYAQRFYVSYKPTVYKGPFSGNVILYLSTKEENPKDATGGPCYRMKVSHIMPDQQIVFTDSCPSYPNLLSKLPRGDYYVQAVWDLDIDGRVIGQSTGNMYNVSRKVTLSDSKEGFALVCDQAVKAPIFVNSTYDKELKAPSRLLTAFYHRPMTVDAAVILPAQYFAEPKRKFPVVFNIGGFGADYHHYSKENGDTSSSVAIDTTACIKVYLDGNCPFGHSVYANSENTGPWGDALTGEFIPLLEKIYRCDGAFLAKGHSSGGYAALWLQVHYPKLFAGCNASAPDPPDFRSFVKKNIYEGLPLKDYKFNYEEVIYRGEQDRSLEAVYDAKAKNGELPTRLYDYSTGKMNIEVLEHWKKYDMSLYLRNNWTALKDDLRDKIRISVGNEDTYFINLPVHLLEDEMKKIGATITFAYYPGDHGSVATPAYRHDQDKWLEEKYQEWLKLHKQ